MCLYTKDARTKTAKTAIICYKVGYRRVGDFMSSVYGHRYVKDGTTPTVKLGISRYLLHEVNKGYHSYKYLLRAIMDTSITNYAVEVFLIPKGAEYIQGKVNGNEGTGYVSTSIIRIGSWWNPNTWWKVTKYKLQ